LFLQGAFARASGDWAGLLRVGESSGLRAFVERELGSIPLVANGGHDGQIYFAVARQPLGGEVSAEVVDAGYRYRRILYPLLAGAGGLIGGRALLWGMILWSAAGMGLATAATASLAHRLGLSTWVVAGILANPGVWLSVQLLTPDALALGLALAGMLAWLNGRPGLATAALAASLLTKEQFALVLLSIVGHELLTSRRGSSLKLAAAASLPLLVWMVWLERRMGGGFTTLGNLTLPFGGIIDSVPGWSRQGPRDFLFGVLALTGLAGAALTTPFVDNRLIRWLTLPWVMIGVVSSSWVWGFGNNALRALAPAIVFGAMALAVVVTNRPESRLIEPR